MKVKASSSSISSCPRGGGEGGTQNDDDRDGVRKILTPRGGGGHQTLALLRDSDDDDSIYRRRRRGGQKSKPTWMEMFFNCVSCKQCVCLACVIILILLAVTIGKSALRDQRSKRHTGVDEFGRKIDQDGNVVHGRRAMMGIMDDDDDGDLTLPSYGVDCKTPWMVALSPRTRVHASRFPRSLWKRRSEKNDAFLKKALDARRVRFDVLVAEESQRFVDFRRTGTRDRRAEIRGRAVFTARESERCSRVSLILFFSVLFSLRILRRFEGIRAWLPFHGFWHRVVQLYHRPRDDAFEEEKRKGNEEKE